MNNVNSRELVNFNHNVGDKHIHNFTNTYLSDDALSKPNKSVAKVTADHTQDAINKILGVKTNVSQKSLCNQVENEKKLEFIRYTPNQKGNGHNSGCEQRIIRMQNVQVDPLAPPQYMHKRVAGGPPSPPVVILRSPPRKLTVQDQLDWKIPASVSNWKNARGYTLPLEMRLAADGRTLQQHTINEKFASLTDSIYIAEGQIRKEIEERNKVQQSGQYHDYMRREEELGKKAKKAMEEKQKVLEKHMDRGKDIDDSELSELERKKMNQRELISYMIKREKEIEVRQAVSGHSKSKLLRDNERDISEKIALGQAQPTSNDVVHDQNLYNKTHGIDSGFRDDDEYNAFDKPLWENRQKANIYGGLKDIGTEYVHDEEKPDVERALSKRVYKGFEGAENKAGSRTRPVEFEKNNDDLFGMSGFIDGQKKIKKD